MTEANEGRAQAEPRPWPSSSRIDQVVVGLILIDFQHDFCSPGGLADRLGYAISELEPVRASARRVLVAARAAGWSVVHTRVGRPEHLIDPGSEGSEDPIVGSWGPLGRHLVQGSPGYEIVDDLAPAPGEVVVDKLGKGAFHGTELDSTLRAGGVTHLVFAGVTSDVCVLSTFREAHDRGYDSLVLTDATGSYWPESHQAAMHLVTTQGGLLGSRTSVALLLDMMPPAGRAGTGTRR